MRKLMLEPKIDLHRHLTGSIGAEAAISIAVKHDVQLPTFVASELHDTLFAHGTLNNLEEYFKPWSILNKLFASREAVHDIVLEAVRAASLDNVKYVEFRTSPRGFLGEKTAFSFEEFVETIALAAIEAEEKFGTIARFILGIPRHVFSKIPIPTRNKMFATMLSVISQHRVQCFVGVDISGDEEAQGADASEFSAFFLMARSHGFPITVHAGERGSVANVEYAVRELGASRVGHGIAAANDSRVLELLERQNCLLEICPTSNKIIGAVGRISELPLNTFYKNTVPFSICTDNPARCRTSLSDEFYKVAKSFEQSVADVRRLTSLAIVHSFADEVTKKKLFAMVESEGISTGVAAGGF